MLKNNKGITLIALVITIIVLLILAGVSIAMLTGNNGILTQATNAQTNTRNAEIKEAVSLAVSTINADLADSVSTTHDYTVLDNANIAKAINATQGAGTAVATTTGITYKKGSATYEVVIGIDAGTVTVGTITEQAK